MQEKWGYDTLNRMTSVTNKRGSTLLSSYVYTPEADGLRTQVVEQQLEADGTYSTVTKKWSYDALQRLTEENYTSTISANNYDDQYVYDLVGNRLSKTHVAGSQTLVSSDQYNPNDQLTSETGTLNGSANYSMTYGYDPNGSLTSVTRTGSSPETDTYTFDLQNRLATANISRTEGGQSVTITATYTYDDSGFRASSVVTTTIGTGSPTTTTTQFLTDVNNLTGYTQVLEEHTNGSTTPSMSYVAGLSILSQVTGLGTASYLMADGQGSTRLLLDSSGTITARYQYDAYGNALGVSYGVTNVPLTKFLYTGQQFDPALQQYYLRARYYVSAVGRFSARDSFQAQASDPTSLQAYLYGAADPVNMWDPTGHFGDMISLMSSMASQLLDEAHDIPAAQGVLTIARAFNIAMKIYNGISTAWDTLQTLAAFTNLGELAVRGENGDALRKPLLCGRLCVNWSEGINSASR